MPRNAQVWIADVKEGSPAQAGGAKANDLLVMAGNQPIVAPGNDVDAVVAILKSLPKDFDFIRQNLGGLELMGFGVEVFGANTLKLDALPTFYKNGADPQSIINEVITELTKTRPEGASRARLNEDALIATICRQAVAAGKPLHDLERQTLIRQLLACEMPYCDPQGRPTLIQTSFQELKKKFGRS